MSYILCLLFMSANIRNFLQSHFGKQNKYYISTVHKAGGISFIWLLQSFDVFLRQEFENRQMS